MSCCQGSHLLLCWALLVIISTLPNRTGTSTVRLTQYDDSNNNKSKTELVPKHNSSTARVWPALGGTGPLCAYRTVGTGDPGRLCFRYTLPDFTCLGGSCRQVTSPDRQLTANILSNSSVLVQWTVAGQAGGFRLSCWWNGSYTQFECGGVHLGSSCGDYLLTELHSNVPYRLCVRPYASEPPGACVEFSLTPGGMQDIVIAMTTVGGAICVMLVIICLLVAYITENIMNPTAQHTHRSHLHTHL